jgi:hypothetical protein
VIFPELSLGAKHEALRSRGWQGKAKGLGLIVVMYVVVKFEEICGWAG